jgi:hypothetical protein
MNNKVIQKHIKKAVIIYEDPETGEGRRVVFGEMPEVMGLIMTQVPIILERVKRLTKKEFKTPLDMITYYLKHKEDWAKLHGIEASDNMELELTYEVKKN